MSQQNAIVARLRRNRKVSDPVEGLKVSRVGGGDTSSAYKYVTSKRAYFVKVNTDVTSKEMFASESKALTLMRRTHTIRVPKVYGYGVLDKGSFIAMEYLDLGHRMNPSVYTELGDQLAAMHSAPVKHKHGKKTHSSINTHRVDSFGFPCDNWLGRTPQINTWRKDWVEFWREHRLDYQIDLAIQNGRVTEQSKVVRLGRELSENILDDLFVGIKVKPALLHGDLWAGNIGCALDLGHGSTPSETSGSSSSSYSGNTSDSSSHSSSMSTTSSSSSAVEGLVPVIFDPASYYGHAEADLGIAHMFGGFDTPFWEAYHARLPKATGFKRRAWLYELHHHLNHLNIFGRGYENGCISLLERLAS